MTIFHFIVLSVFVLVCIFITWTSQRKCIRVIRTRDRYAEALLTLIVAASKLPTDINTSPEWQEALRIAAKTSKLKHPTV